MINMASLGVVSQLTRSLAFAGRANVSRVLATSRLLNAPEQPKDTASRRLIFTGEYFEIEKFDGSRRRAFARMGRYKEKFLERFDESLNIEDGAVISDDLVNLILLAENNEKEVELLKRAILKFEKQNESLQYGTYGYGSLVMRFATQFNCPDLAMMLMHPECYKFFHQISTVTMALNLLFKNGRYDDVITLFDFVAENYKFNEKYPVDFVTIFMAACYKLNTIESYDRAYRLLRVIKNDSEGLKMRGMTCFLALAINQNHNNVANEIIQQLNFQSYPIMLQSLRVLALAKVGKFQDVFSILRNRLSRDKASNLSMIVFQDTLDIIEKLIAEGGKKELIDGFANILKNLHESNLVEKDRTLDQSLTEPLQLERNLKTAKPRGPQRSFAKQ